MASDNVASARIKRVRAPWLIASLMLAGVLVSGAVWFVNDLTESEQFLAIAEDIERGDEITNESLASVSLSGDVVGSLNLIRPSELEEVLGKNAIAPLPQGTLLSEGLLANATEVPEGFVLMGMNADQGTYPLRSLSIGDLVAIVEVPRGFGDEERVGREVTRARIWSNPPTGGSGMFITFEIPNEDAGRASAVLSNNAAFLVLVDEETPTIEMDISEFPEEVVEEAQPDSMIERDGVVAFPQDGVAVIIDAGQGAVIQDVREAFETVYIDLDLDGVNDEDGEDIPARFLGYLD